MINDGRPKVFISYSWSADAIVIPLAKRLVSLGVDVVFDKWDLKEGQDKYEFMEQSVNDDTIDKVLIVSDRKYAEKANSRTGGVGDETAIISSEVYGNMKQEKFIPVIAECDDKGNPYVPTYIKSRIYIDLSDENRYEEEFEKLLRNIYEKPLMKHPKIGKAPEWLEDKSENLFLLNDINNQLKKANTEKKAKALIERFFEEHKAQLIVLYNKPLDSGEQIYLEFEKTKDLRNTYLDFLNIIIEQDINYVDLLITMFEDLYNCLTDIHTFNPTANSAGADDVDLYKIYIWELFICTITFFRYHKEYKIINEILCATYFINESLFGGSKRAQNYTCFRHYSSMVEEQYKMQTENKNKFTLLGDTICNKREYLPIYTKVSLAQTDLFLYQMYNGLDLSQEGTKTSYWFPAFYVYADQEYMEDWIKLKSKRYCNKIFDLFGIDNIEELKVKISRCTHDSKMCYNGSFDTAFAILDYIKLDEIGSIN